MINIGKKFILGTLVFLTVLVFIAVYQKTDQKPEVVFLDVGQGDSILIILPGDTQILIDGGPSSKISSKLSKYFPFYDKDIELVILTHPHNDHLNGLVSVFKDYNVKNFIWSGANYESKLYSSFVEALKKEGSNVYFAKAGDVVSYGNQPILKILYPAEILLGKSFKSIHESNIVSELDLGNKKFLLMGDSDEVVESRVVSSDLVSDIDILKVGHHGSKTSTAIGLLNLAKPEEAVISVGNNSYGHPAANVLSNLFNVGAEIFRTDEVGDVVYK
jgi:competence protein ComEC